jgi:hypothetical protein
MSMPLLIKGIGGEALGSLINDCILSRRVVPQSSQLVPCTFLKACPLMMLVFRASRNCPTVGLLLIPQYERIAPSVLSKGILIQVSGVKVLETRLFHCPPQVLGSSNVS